MPAPFVLAPAAIWIVGGVTGLAVTYAMYKNWDKIKEIAKGKQITVLGQRATGKTTLLNFLLKGEITVEYEQTLFKKKIKKQKFFSLTDLALNVFTNKIVRPRTNAYDVGGSEDQHGVWKELAEGADVIIYLFDVNKWLNNPELEPIIERDIKVIADIIRSPGKDKKDKKVMLIGTHLDQDKGYKMAKDKVAYKDEIKGEAFIINMRSSLGGRDRCIVELASLNDKEGLSAITSFILANGFGVDQ